jgi:hypothetical protein
MIKLTNDHLRVISKRVDVEEFGLLIKTANRKKSFFIFLIILRKRLLKREWFKNN